MAKKVQRERIVTPFGVAVYPRLNKPDTRFDADGVYKVDLRLDPNDLEVAKMVEKIQKFAAKNGKPVDKIGIKHEAGEDGAPTGMILVKFKVKATWKDGTSRKPAIVDAGKKEVDGIVGGGSVIRISGEMSPYDGFGGGVSLCPLAVQVKELKTWSKGVDDFDVVDGETASDSDDGDDEPEF